MFGDIPRIGARDLARYADCMGNAMAASGGVENIARFNLSGIDGTSGRLWVEYFTPVITTTITKLAVASGSVAASGVTLARLALFAAAPDDSVALVARTASDTGIGASTFVVYERNLDTTGGYPASYTVTAGARYALGWLMVATTPCAVQGGFVLDSGKAPVASRVIDGQSDIGTAYSPPALDDTSNVPYLRGRP